MLAGSGVRWMTDPPIAAELTSASRRGSIGNVSVDLGAGPDHQCADVDVDRAAHLAVERQTGEATGEVTIHRSVDPAEPAPVDQVAPDRPVGVDHRFP